MNTYPADHVVVPALRQKTEIRGSYDVAVIGGGLAGLALSIQMAKKGYSTILFEKEQYPFHRVCGEYISLESWDFLEDLGYPLSEMDLPLIKNLLVSSPGGKLISHKLTPGGFGISRFKMDQDMALLARRNGVHLLEEHKVTDVVFNEPVFDVFCASLRYQAKVVCGSFGKRSNLDIKWKRPFTDVKPGKLNNYVGVKYHVKTDFPEDTIALHNFANGYCGISRIEDEKYCLCYLTTARNLKANDNSIPKLEANILQRNPFLKKAFSECEMLYNSPVTISQISFQRKSLVENHVLMVGDAGGMITPLCGNGMSMALHGSKVAAGLIHRYLCQDISQSTLEQEYVQQWNRLFSRRLQTGRLIQRFFGKESLTNIFINSIKPFPNFISYLIRQTHGEPF